MQVAAAVRKLALAELVFMVSFRFTFVGEGTTRSVNQMLEPKYGL